VELVNSACCVFHCGALLESHVLSSLLDVFLREGKQRPAALCTSGLLVLCLEDRLYLGRNSAPDSFESICIELPKLTNKRELCLVIYNVMQFLRNSRLDNFLSRSSAAFVSHCLLLVCTCLIGVGHVLM